MKKRFQKPKNLVSFMLVLAILTSSFAIPSNAETVKAETYTTNVNPSDYKNYVDYLEALTLSLGGKKVNPNDSTGIMSDVDENRNPLYYTYLSWAIQAEYVIPANCTTLLVDIGNYPVVGYNSDGTKTVIVKTDGYTSDGYDKDGYDSDGYDMSGYDRSGYNRSGYDRNGYDRNGYDRNGYDRNGNNKDGKNKDKGIKINKATFGDLASILSKKKYDEDRDGYLSDDEIFFNVDELDTGNKKISNIKGLELLEYCKEINIGNYAGKTLKIDAKNIKKIGVGSKTKLTVNAPYAETVGASGTKVIINAPKAIHVSGAGYESLNLKNCKSAQSLIFSAEANKKIIFPKDKSNIKYLQFFSGYKTKTTFSVNKFINSSEFKGFKNLEFLSIDGTDIKTLNLSSCKKLKYLRIYACDNIKSIDLSKNKKFVYGFVRGNKKLKTVKKPPKGKVSYTYDALSGNIDIDYTGEI